MDVKTFRKARARYDEEIPYSDLKKFHARTKEIEEAASPEHSPTLHGEYILDWMICSCGWQSAEYLDGVDPAWDEWREHVADVMGLVLRKCPCGKKYVPIDDGGPCHELRSIKIEQKPS